MSVQSRQRTLVDVAREWSQHDVDPNEQDGDKDRVEQLTRSSAGADRRGAPERGCSIEPADIAAIFHDGAGAEKSHAGNHVGNDLRRARRNRGTEVDEGCRPKTYQRIGAQTRGALPPLPLGADERA